MTEFDQIDTFHLVIFYRCDHPPAEDLEAVSSIVEVQVEVVSARQLLEYSTLDMN